MIKWMSRVATSRGKSLLPSTIITLVIVAMLLISGPAQAVAVVISGIQDSYTKGDDIDFQVKIELNDPDKYVPISNISLDLTGPISKKIFFTLDGNRISGDCNIRIKPVSIPKDDFGYGSGYGYDTRTGYGYNFGNGYGYGYGYGGGGEKISYIYNVTIDTDSKCLPEGNYSVVATLNTGKNVAFQSPTINFRLLPVAPGQKIKAKVDIKPETINLASKGKFTAFITLPEGFDVRDIDVGTVVIEGAHAVKSMISKENGGTLIAKFNTQDLEDVHTGNAVKFTVTGKVDGTEFEGSDTVKVIDQGKGQKEVEECECDDHAKEDDHDDECDDKVKEHDHDDECDDNEKEHDHEDDKVKERDHEEKKAKNQKQQKNKDDDQKNKNNGDQARNNVVNNNNVYITNNSGTVNVYINNQGSSTDVNQGGNNNNNNNGNKKGNHGNNGKGKK